MRTYDLRSSSLVFPQDLGCRTTVAQFLYPQAQSVVNMVSLLNRLTRCSRLLHHRCRIGESVRSVPRAVGYIRRSLSADRNNGAQALSREATR